MSPFQKMKALESLFIRQYSLKGILRRLYYMNINCCIYYS